MSEARTRAVLGRRMGGALAVSCAVGVLLFAGGALKAADQGAEREVPRASGVQQALSDPLLLLTLVVCEILVGAMLLCGLFPRLTRALGVACFSLFACVSLYLAASGAASCGCFGAVQINPWLACAVDVCTVAALVRLGPESHARLGASARRALLGAVAFGALALLALPTGSWLRFALGALSSNGREDTFLLDPEAWVGRRLPVLDQIETTACLERGEWLLLFYHHGCPDCERAAGLLGDRARAGGGRQVAMIEVAPFGAFDAQTARLHFDAFGYLRPEDDRVMPTPYVALLRDGKVARCSSDASASLDWSEGSP